MMRSTTLVFSLLIIIQAYGDRVAASTSQIEFFSVDEIYSDYCRVFGNVSFLTEYHVRQIINDLMNGCSLTYGAEHCLSGIPIGYSNKMKITNDRLAQISLSLFCRLAKIDQPAEQALANCSKYADEIISQNSLQKVLQEKIYPFYKPILDNYHASLSIKMECIEVTSLLERTNSGECLFTTLIYHLFNRVQIGCDLPYSSWFIDQLFVEDEKLTTSMELEDLEELMKRLRILKQKPNDRSEIIDPTQKPVPNDQGNKPPSPPPDQSNGPSKSKFDRCYGSDEIAEIFDLNEPIYKGQFEQVCPALLYLKLNTECGPRQDRPPPPERPVTPAEKYGYGTLAICVITITAVILILILPCFDQKIYRELLSFLTSLGVGSLISDAILHIIPEALVDKRRVDKKPEDHSVQIQPYVITLTLILIALYLFWLFETLAHRFSKSHGHAHSHRGANQESESDPATSSSTQLALQATHVKYPLSFNLSSFRKLKSVGWIIFFGDLGHNLADGLAIGASFSQSINLGLATSIAVLFHEIPHELGNYAVLVKSGGISHCETLFLNVVSAIPCFVGFFIAVSIPSDSQVICYILALTAGMFIYTSLVSILPGMMNKQKWSWTSFILCNLGLWIGFSLMFVLVILEDYVLL